ncbi:MAG: hypothetical protein DMG97_37775 [Acidobacteria bacterium]|nr:MAG: hypothetical protein DMG97_37775 [Acidobacteriota bacterium]
MKLAIGTLFLASMLSQFAHAQTNSSAAPVGAEAFAAAPAAVPEPSKADGYTVFNATPAQEAALRAQIRLIHRNVLPLRIFLVPHWKYLAAARDFHLHIPTGYGSVMFTHLPSRTVFIDNDHYWGEDWLGYWIAHELGHLASNSTKEEDAEKLAREYRKRPKDAGKPDAH